MAETLAHRCLNHAGREAAARCPACGQFFCRECVTEHDGVVICSVCLRKQSAGATERHLPVAALARALAVAAGFMLGWLAFHTVGQLLVSLPADFHEGTVWKIPYLDQP